MFGTLLAYLLGIIFLLLSSLFLLYTVYLFYVHHKYSHLPSPNLPSFYFGHLPDIIRLRKQHKNPYLPFKDVCEYWMQDAGSRTIVVFIFHKVRIFIADPEVVKVIVMDIKNPKPTSFFHTVYGERFLGNGIGTVRDHESWKPKRQLYDPAFKKSYLKELVPRFNSLVDDFLEKLRPLADGKTIIPLRDYTRSFILEVVNKIIFGLDNTNLNILNITLPPGHVNVMAYINDKVFKGSNNQLTSIYPPWMHYFHPLEAKGYQEAVKAFREIGRNCIEQRLKDIKNGESHKDLLTNILQTVSLKETLNLEDLVDDFCTFYSAGYDTSSNLLHFAIILIHQHPDVLTRLLEEINEVLGDKREVSAEDIDKLNYMQQVLNESLRMYSITPGITKSLNTDLTVGDKVFPAHTEYLLTNSVICSMPEYFENPDIFNPDRFAPGMGINSFAFFPFGLGHRACIGKQFALMELKIILARLLQTYSLTLPDDYELILVQYSFLQPKDNLPCTLRPVDGNY